VEHLEKVEILLVEDNPNDVELILRALSKHNLDKKVHVLKDGAEALDYIFGTNTYAGRDVNDRAKVIFLDLKLPGLDGLEVLRKVKSDERTKIIPVVVLTSSADQRNIVESYQLGVNSYIIKPVSFDEFANAVSKIAIYWLLLNLPPN
jgi:two-component system, response regulator